MSAYMLTSRRRAWLVPLLAVTVLGAGCRRAADDGGNTASAATPIAGPIAMADTAQFIELERGACFGRCPVYMVRVRGDGAVRYEGMANVADSGVRESRLDDAAVRALFARFDASAFTTADSAYVEGSANCGSWMTDAPLLTLRRMQGQDTRTVRFDAGCTAAPRWVPALAAAVDSAAGTSRWITSRPNLP